MLHTYINPLIICYFKVYYQSIFICSFLLCTATGVVILMTDLKKTKVPHKNMIKPLVIISLLWFAGVTLWPISILLGLTTKTTINPTAFDYITWYNIILGFAKRRLPAIQQKSIKKKNKRRRRRNKNH